MKEGYLVDEPSSEKYLPASSGANLLLHNSIYRKISLLQIQKFRPEQSNQCGLASAFARLLFAHIDFPTI